MSVDTNARSQAFVKYLGSQGSAQARKPKIHKRATSEQSIQALKDLGYGVASLAPISGEVISAKEGVQDFQKGNYGMAALGAVGAIPFAGIPFRAAKGLLKGAVPAAVEGSRRMLTGTSAGNVVNQVAVNMPTRVGGFYSGTPVTSFARDFIKEIPDAMRTRASAQERAYQDVWGTSKTKVKDIKNQSKAAERFKARGEEDIAKISGADAEKTAMSIEAQQSPNIIPKEQRGALANGIDGLAYYDVGIPQAEVARIAKGIGRGNRLATASNIPKSIVDRATRHLTDGPHVRSGTDDIYEYQIKTLESSDRSGLLESAGGGRGSILVRAFNANPNKEKSVAPFDSYSKTINGLKGKRKNAPIEPEEAIEFLQLAATLDKKATKKINKAMKWGTGYSQSQLLTKISTARATAREGKKLHKNTQELVNVFDELIAKGSVKIARVADEAGEVVSHADFNQIKKPRGTIAAQTAYHSAQKELGGVNQLVIMDLDNKINYSMISDGHDIFNQAPLGGHHLITAQPILAKPWLQEGFTVQHKTNMTRDNVMKALVETAERTGKKPPKMLREGRGANLEQRTRKWTRKIMDEDVVVSAQHTSDAAKSKRKLGAVKTAGYLGAGGLMTAANRMPTEEELGNE